MKITTGMTPYTEIQDAEGLDPIRVFWMNYGCAQGRVIIECYGQAWSHYWNSMGDTHTSVQDFFKRTGTDYLAHKLIENDTLEVDWEQVAKELGIDFIDPQELGDYEDELCSEYGEDWRYLLPKKDTNEYTYVCRIIEAIKQSFDVQPNTLGGADAKA